MTMVDGRVVAEAGALKSADMPALIEEVHKVLPGLFDRRAAFLAENVEGAKSPV